MNGRKRQDQFPDLSPRQLQILKLLQEGKPNKALSEELGIGLGTVKQHLVALFKKLNVKNRAMAVSLAANMQQAQEEEQGTSLRSALLLDRRPCVVLSVSLPQEAGQQLVRLMLGSLAAIAADNEAIFLARSGNAGDVVFGIQHATEYVLPMALHTAQAVYHDLMLADGDMAKQLRGCLVAGHAFASMQHFGGWTGEALASAVISSARELLDTVNYGRFVIDGAARDLIALFGIEGISPEGADMSFDDFGRLGWSGVRPDYGLIGRGAELEHISAALDAADKGCLLLVEGEMGMGKSRLCEEALRLCVERSGSASFYRCLPATLGGGCWDVAAGGFCSMEDVHKRLCSRNGRPPVMVIVDDVHLLPAAKQVQLLEAVAVARQSGKLAILSGRKIAAAQQVEDAGRIVLRRMPSQVLQGLVRRAMEKGSVPDRVNRVLSLSSAAAGVPLFAIELARHGQGDEHLPLTLQIAINARLDSLRLDRRLLREVARQAAGMGMEEVIGKISEDAQEVRRQINIAVAAGVLNCNDDGWISFTHPLLRQAINDTITD